MIGVVFLSRTALVAYSVILVFETVAQIVFLILLALGRQSGNLTTEIVLLGLLLCTAIMTEDLRFRVVKERERERKEAYERRLAAIGDQWPLGP